MDRSAPPTPVDGQIRWKPKGDTTSLSRGATDQKLLTEGRFKCRGRSRPKTRWTVHSVGRRVLAEVHKERGKEAGKKQQLWLLIQAQHWLPEEFCLSSPYRWTSSCSSSRTDLGHVSLLGATCQKNAPQFGGNPPKKTGGPFYSAA